MLDQVDIQSDGAESDISATETQSDTPEAPSVADDTTQSQDPQDQVDADSKEQKTYVPFSAGKEKFKVNGQEKEWDWATTKKYAQLGYSGQVAMERAHETETKAKKLYSDLMDYAQRDPEGLIRVLNPKFQGFSSHAKPAASSAGQAGQTQGQEIDPRDAKIKELEERYQSVEQILEKQEIEKERQAIAAELDSACKEYPELNNEISREYVKAQYKRALSKGLDMSIEDVAFHTAQKIREQREAETKEKQARLQKNREKAPVSGAPAGSAGAGKPMTREDVMRLAGRV